MSTTKLELTHDWSADQWDWPLQHNDDVVRVTNTKEKFEVTLDASCFTPKEIEVKVCGENLVIHLRHEVRSDQFGDITREVNRTYRLPPDVDPKSLKSNLSTRGHLVITAGKKS